MCSILTTALSRGNNKKHRERERRGKKGGEDRAKSANDENRGEFPAVSTQVKGVELVSFPRAESAFPTRNPTDRDSSRTLTLRGLSLPRDTVSLSFNLSFFRTFSRPAEISLVLGFISSPCRCSPGFLSEPRR